MVWYLHLFKNFPQFVVIHTIKGFGIVSKAEIFFFFLELSCFFDDPMDVGNLISGSSAFLNPAWTSGSSWFIYCWSLAWRILSISLLVCPSNEYSGLISFRIDWLDLLAVQGTFRSLLQHHSLKVSILQCSPFFMVQLSHPNMFLKRWILHCTLRWYVN